MPNARAKERLGGDHPLVGRSAPDFALADGTRLNERLRNARGVLLDFDACPALRNVANRWSDRLDHVAMDARDRLGASAVLVRPDGIVAWVHDEAVLGEAELADAISRWFGAASGC